MKRDAFAHDSIYGIGYEHFSSNFLLEGSDMINYLISGASIFIAIWQIIRNRNLNRYIKAEAMEAYSDTAILLGNVQKCLDQLKAGNATFGIEAAGKAEGITQALFARSIKNIHHHFNYDRKDVDDWINNKKIYESHKDSFLRYAE